MEIAEKLSVQQLQTLLEAVYVKGYMESHMRTDEMIRHIQSQLLSILKTGHQNADSMMES